VDRTIGDLFERLADAEVPRAARDLAVARITLDSREVRPGDLWIALRGTDVDSHGFIEDVAAAGATAVVVDREVGDVGVPVVRVPDSRRALAGLAAAWYGHPAERLTLVGITGTLGKTSVLSMLEAILARSGMRVGSIGSLGIRVAGETRDTGHTVPPPLELHAALARMVEEGVEVAMTEVTTHAISQHRVHGLRFQLGVFTNLVPMEHMEYHGTFEDYVAVKTRYFEFLRPGAPVVHASGDRAVVQEIRRRGVRGIGCGGDPDADLFVERLATDAGGSTMELRLQRPVPRVGGGEVGPINIPLRIRLLGRANANNAALAAGAALCLGAPVEAIRDALAAVAPPRRRMQVLQTEPFTVLDDTVGHPDSITAVMEVAEGLPHRRLHIVFAVRGQRGETVNRQAADALGVWLRRVPDASLVVTTSEDTADERNTVDPTESEAFVAGLDEGGIRYREEPTLRGAVRWALGHVESGDLLLLLGAQGMDAAAGMVLGDGNVEC
jgi:UDP-N-acetylmuramoyl-L-alanyl-D-glutamate--2,6-diaminopimelate ligase